MPVDPVRDCAIRVLLKVYFKRAFISQALDRTLTRKGTSISPRGRRFMAQLVFGTVRHTTLCDSIIADHLNQPLGKLPDPILVVLRMGVFQSLFCNQVTFPAMVHTSVDLAKRHGHAGTARLVNAVLKRVAHNLDEVSLPDPNEEPHEYLSLRYSMPLWLVRRWCKEVGYDHALAMCIAFESEAPRTARVNTHLISRESLLKFLQKSDCPAEAHPSVPDAIIFTQRIPFRGKAFLHGHFFIQDPASMLSAHLMEPRPGERILDMCAAPGGKSTHLAQLANCEAKIVSLDVLPGRLGLLKDNIERLNLSNVAPVVGDGLRSPFVPAFDRVLIDAPCSGLGTLRRHPDLKLRIQERDIEQMAQTQASLLRCALALCKNGGLVVYSVCTFTPEETEAVTNPVIDEGLAAREDGSEWLNQWKIALGQYRIRPEIDQLDGYYLTRLRKAS